MKVRREVKKRRKLTFKETGKITIVKLKQPRQNLILIWINLMPRKLRTVLSRDNLLIKLLRRRELEPDLKHQHHSLTHSLIIILLRAPSKNSTPRKLKSKD
jgi:hypothetical protein